MLRSLGVAAAAAAAAAVMVPALALLLPRWLQALALSFGHVLLGLPRVAEVDGGGGASGSFPPPHSFFSRSVGDTTMALCVPGGRHALSRPLSLPFFGENILEAVRNSYR